MTHADAPDVTFYERQQFRQWWIWALVLIVPITVVAVAVCSVPHMPPAVLCLILLPPLIVVPLFYVLRLDTVVRSDGLYIRFYPFWWRRIGFDEIQSCQVRTYRPIREYGGWGIRYGLSGKA